MRKIILITLLISIYSFTSAQEMLGMKMPKKLPPQKEDSMGNMDMSKTDLGFIKTVQDNTPPHTVRYDLYIRDTIVTFGKKPRRAIAVNGQIPPPTAKNTA